MAKEKPNVTTEVINFGFHFMAAYVCFAVVLGLS
jgi:hypothetical protein